MWFHTSAESPRSQHAGAVAVVEVDVTVGIVALASELVVVRLGATVVVGAVVVVGATVVVGASVVVGVIVAVGAAVVVVVDVTSVGIAPACGTAVTTLLYGPQPIALRAATRNRYDVPFVKADTIEMRFVDTPSLSDVQSTPFVER